MLHVSRSSSGERSKTLLGGLPHPLTASACLHRGNLDKATLDGSTALHYSAQYNQPNCLKLLLKGKAALSPGRLQA